MKYSTPCTVGNNFTFHLRSKGEVLSLSSQDYRAEFGSFGRLSSSHKVSKTYWNAEGLISCVDNKDGSKGQYLYYPDGKRLASVITSKDASIKSTVYIGDYAEYTKETKSLTKYYMVSGQRVAKKVSGKDLEIFIKDPVGSTSLIVDKKGQVIYHNQATAFGVTLSESNKGFDHYRYAAGIEDRGSGLHQMGVRNYMPEFGRFVSHDPMFMEDPSKCMASPIECNLYAYAGNNPVINIDPSGYELAAAWQHFKDAASNIRVDNVSKTYSTEATLGTAHLGEKKAESNFTQLRTMM